MTNDTGSPQATAPLAEEQIRNDYYSVSNVAARVGVSQVLVYDQNPLPSGFLNYRLINKQSGVMVGIYREGPGWAARIDFPEKVDARTLEEVIRFSDGESVYVNPQLVLDVDSYVGVLVKTNPLEALVPLLKYSLEARSI